MSSSLNHAVRRGLFVLGLLTLAAAPLAAQPAPSLFTPASRDAAADAGNATIVRARYVRFAADRLASADAQDVAPRVTLNLFDDVTFAAALDRVDRSADGYVWVGRIPDVAMSTVTLATSRGVMYGSILTPAATYIVKPAGGGDYLVTQIDQSRFPAEAPPVTVSAPQAARDAAQPPPVMTDDASTIDVMVLYTPSAAAAASGGITALVNNAISIANTTYANSGVTQRLRLVYSAQVNYTESGDNGVDLGNIYAGTGVFSGVAALRDTWRADLVSLITQTTNSPYCGVAYKLSAISTSFAPYGYSVVEQSCAVGNLTFPHELGHNMGAGHDWYVDNGVTPQTYAHGFVNPNAGQRWRTVMAYNNLCFDNGFSCARIAYWANPGLTYNGAAMGVPNGTNSASSCYFNLSNPACDADDHRTLNETALAVANFRQASATPLSVTQFTSNAPSTIAPGTPVTWTAAALGGTSPYTYKFLVYNGSAWTVARDWSASNTWTWTPSAAGSYTFQVWVRNSGSANSYDAWSAAGPLTVTVPPLALTGVSGPSTATAGVPVTFTAAAVGGTPPTSYRFHVFDGVSWSVARDWSTTSQWTWTPPTGGTYSFQVWARNSGSSGIDAARNFGPITVGVPASLTVTGLTSSVPSTAPAGTPVTWSARAIGGTRPYTYRFYVSDGVTWTIAQDWSSASEWTWIPPSAGTYSVQVWVRNAGSGATYDAWGGVSGYAVNPAVALAPVSILSDPAGSVPAGTPVTWTARAIGGSGPYSYKFYVYNGSAWTVGQDWGASNTWTWVPPSAGSYSFQVWMRNNGSAAAYDGYMSVGPVNVSSGTPLTIGNVTVSPGTPLVANSPATVVTTATGGSGPYRYKYWVYNGSTWSVGRDWDASHTWQWVPPASGTYYVQVWVQNTGGGVTYDAYRQIGPIAVNP